MHPPNQLYYPSSTSSTLSNPWAPRAPSSSTTEDEPEVVFDLDEAAMEQLPVHLQCTMREIQRERIRRLSHGPENILTSMTMTEIRAVESRETYADRWVQNVMARISTDLEMSVARGTRDMDMTADVGPFDRLLVPVGQDLAGYNRAEEEGGRYYGRSRSRLGRDGFLACRESFEGNGPERCTCGRCGGGHGEKKLAAEHVSELHGTGAGEVEGDKMQRRQGKTGRFRKAIMSAMRVRVQKSFQKMSMLFRK